MPTVSLVHPDLVGELLKSTVNIAKGPSYHFIQPWLGTGLLTSTGTKWRTRRHLITPSFHFDVLKGFVEVFREQARVLVDVVLSKHADTDSDESVDVFPIVTCCALDIICESAMGQSVNAQADPTNAYVTAVIALSTQIFNRFLSPWQWNDLVYRNLLPSGRAFVANLNVVQSFTRKVIEAHIEQQRHASPSSSMDSVTPRQRKVFLDMLLAAKDPDGNALSFESIHEEVETFMFEGHDTTAAAISWCLFCLAKDRDYQRRIQDELDTVLGDRRIPAYDDLGELHVLENAIKESLRLYPSVPIIARILDEDLHVDDKVIPKGTQVAVIISALHRQPSIWGPDAQEFRPDRFDDRKSQTTSPFEYLPFSAGSRNCIGNNSNSLGILLYLKKKKKKKGQRFAQLEERTVIAAILKTYDVVLDTTKPEPEMSPELILRPVGGINVKLHRRRAFGKA